MWKENTISSHLTEQQRSRISQNYRAAKALLERKRPPCTESIISPLAIKQKPRLPVESVRTPLAEIPSNSCSYVTEDTSCFKTPTITPFPNTFEEDDDFNESILLEIDAICEKSNPRSQHSIVYPPSSPALSYQSTSTGENSVPLRALFNDEEADSNPSSFSGNCREYWDQLNDKQREAACSDIATPLVITAGPGSGKTSTMVGRVLMLLNEGICASKVLAMTFTSAAASEMRDRIAKVAGKEASKELTISTFHSFSLNLCRKHAEKFGRTSEFSIFGQTHQRRAIIEAIRLTETDESNQVERFKDKSKKWQTFVAKAKASGLSHEDYKDSESEIGVAILRRYNEILKSCDAMDYHDLIIFSVKLLSEYPDVLNECHVAWNAVVIDEFQDTSSMQYKLLRLLASHNRITVVGDDNQSIFSFNGADVSGFESFRRDFPNHTEVRLSRNYRSTRYIVEGASSLIRHNFCRLQNDSFTENDDGAKIVIKECQHEQAQCAFVIDKTIEFAFQASSEKPDYSKCAILYRRQTSGKLFQSSFRERRIPFNSHGVAFYRKKTIKAILALLKTALPLCDDVSFRHSFKALLPFDKDEKKKVIEYIDKVSASRKRGFLETATDIFEAKVSGTFKKRQITQGRKVLQTLDMISKLVAREESLSAVVTTVSNTIPQKYLLEKRAVVDVDGGKYLNEDNDPRSVLQHLLDDVSNFLSNKNDIIDDKGCVKLLKSFVDYTTERERENFAVRKRENENSVTLTTIHQSKGLEWDVVFIVKANETEIPLLHEFHGLREHAPSIEEERRLLYVAMTRARKRLFILHVSMDSNWQILQPSRFLREIPDSVREHQAEVCHKSLELKTEKISEEKTDINHFSVNYDVHETYGDTFVKRFSVDERPVVSQLFRRWAKKPAFQNPERLLLKVKCVIDERVSATKEKHKAVLRDLKAVLNTEEALQYAKHVLQWEQIPADQRVLMTREKQEHFQKLRIENSMGCSAPTDKQIGYLQKLGCTTTPSSRLHASKLIEQYKAL